MTDDERRAYARAYHRGYHAGSNGRWPDHRPPAPPDEQVAALMRAAQALRDEVDNQIATICEGDPWAVALGPPMDAVTEALAAIGRWLRRGEEADRG